MTDESVISTRKKPRSFYGWNVVAASFMAQLSYAEYHSSMLGFFFRSFQNEFGWNRSALAAVQTITRVAEAMARYNVLVQFRQATPDGMSMAPPVTHNEGYHIIHTGGRYEVYLFMPKMP